MKKKVLLIIAIFGLLVLTGCSSSYAPFGYSYEEYYYDNGESYEEIIEQQM